MAGPEKTLEKNMAGDFDPKNFLSSFFQIARAVLLSPKAFYEGMKTDGGLRNPLLFLVCCVAIHTAIASLFVKQPVVLFNVVYGILMPFVTAGVLFLILTRIFKAPGTFEAAFRVTAYAAATALLSWIPVAFRTDVSASPGTLFSLIAWTGLFIEFYRLYLIALGLSRTFSVTVSRAALAIVITAFIYVMTLGPFVKYLFGPQQPGSPPSSEIDSPETSMIYDRPQLVAKATCPGTCDLKT